MAYYSTGTISVMRGSPVVEGTGTGWGGNVVAGEGLRAPDGLTYEVDAVVSDTQLTLAANYGGLSATDQPYLTLPPDLGGLLGAALDVTNLPGSSGGGGSGGGIPDLDDLPAASFPLSGASFAIISQATTEKKVALDDLMYGQGKGVGVVDLMRYKPAVGADVTAQILEAATEARALGHVLRLPPYPVQFSQTVSVRGIVGIPGKSKLVIAPDFTKTGFANQFCIINPNFSQGYNDATADEILFAGFDLESSPNAGRSFIGLGNVRRGKVLGFNAKVNRVISGVTGKPVAVDSILDLYAAVKHLEVAGCDMRNITGAYGASKISEFGGSCMWIRNLSGNGSVAANVTELIDIHHNYFEHMTSDEVLAVFGVRGVTRKVRVNNNRFIGLPSIAGVHHNTFISFFPLDDGSGVNLGNTAAVYGCEFKNNYIEDGAWIYDVVRIGNAADNDRPCYNNQLAGNRVYATRSSDPAYGVLAMWGALHPELPNPELASAVFRCVEGTFGQAYFQDTSGNSSTSDTASSFGSTCNSGFNGFQQVTDPTTLGNIYSGMSNCRAVKNGKVEAGFRGFVNCRSVMGTDYRVIGAGAKVFVVESSITGVYSMTNTTGECAGSLIDIGVGAKGKVAAFNNVLLMTGAATSPILRNASGAGATLMAQNNVTQGANGGITAGGGSITRSGNDWNGVTD
jgi:hypothetical protein